MDPMGKQVTGVRTAVKQLLEVVFLSLYSFIVRPSAEVISPHLCIRCLETVPKHILPNGGFFMAMNPMVESVKKKHLKQTQ